MAKPLKVWEWGLRSRIFDSWSSFAEPEFPRISHVSAYAARQGGLGLRYGLESPAII